MPVHIEPIASHHDCRAFDCGEEGLNDYLRRFARQNDLKDIGRTFVAVEAPGSPVVCGYFTLSGRALHRTQLPDARGLPGYPLHVALIARLAIDRRWQGQGLGEQLLMAALRRCAEAADRVATFAVVVDSLHEKAKAFYVRYGFEPVLDDPLHLFLPMRTVRELLRG